MDSIEKEKKNKWEFSENEVKVWYLSEGQFDAPLFRNVWMLYTCTAVTTRNSLLQYFKDDKASTGSKQLLRQILLQLKFNRNILL